VPVAEGDVPDSASDATPTFEEYEAMREAWLAACMSIDAVIVADQESRSRFFGEGLSDLMGGPLGCGVGGDIEVDDFASVVTQHDEDVEDAERHDRNREEVDGCDLVPPENVIRDESGREQCS
jgi:hypothetical protein